MHRFNLDHLRKSIPAIGLFACLSAQMAMANDTPNLAPSDDYIGLANGSFVVAPIPFKNPLIESGLALGGAYLFQSDENSDTSNIGLGGFRSSNGSQAFGASFKYAWDENRWHFGATIARGDLKYDLYTQIGPVPIKQSGNFGRISLRRGFSDIYSFTGYASYLETSIDLDVELPSQLPDIRLGTDLAFANLGIEFERDTTNSDYYPTNGTRFVVNASFGRELTRENRNSYTKGHVALNGYYGLTDSTVVAGKAFQCFAEEGTPFFDQCSPGAGDGFRGYSPTQFLGPRSSSVQGEIRQRIGERFGVVAFGGAGTGETSYGKDIGMKYAGGLGLRFRLSRKFPLDFSADVAINDLRDKTYYIYVGQRF